MLQPCRPRKTRLRYIKRPFPQQTDEHLSSHLSLALSITTSSSQRLKDIIRSSQSLTGTKLSSDNDDIVANARHQVLLDKRAEQAAKHADVKAKLTFLETLTEMCLNIYRFAFDTKKPRDLLFLKAPVLGIISRQVRREVLPVFFSECCSALALHCNVGDRPGLDIMAEQGDIPAGYVPTRSADITKDLPVVTQDMSRRYLNYLGHRSAEISRHTRAWLSRLSDEEGGAVSEMMKIDLTVSRIKHLSSQWYTPPQAAFMKATIRVPMATHSAPVLDVEVQPPWVSLAEYTQVVAWVKDAVERVAGSRETFVGFTLADLDELSMAVK